MNFSDYLHILLEMHNVAYAELLEQEEINQEREEIPLLMGKDGVEINDHPIDA